MNRTPNLVDAAIRQLARSGSDTQVAAARKVLTEAKRSLYLILAEDPGTLGGTDQS